MTDTFDPAIYEDEVRARMLAAIERKIEGHEIAEEPTEEPKAQVIDLMQALKSSLAKGDHRKPSKRSPRKAAKAASGKTAAARSKKKGATKKKRAG